MPPQKILLESKYRNITNWPSVHEFEFTEDQTALWPSKLSENNNWYDVAISTIIVPYRAALASQPFLLLHLKNGNHRQKNNIVSGSSKARVNECSYILFCEKIMGTDWIFYKSAEVLRMEVYWRDTWHFSIRDVNGDPLIINPTQDETLPENQVSCHLFVTPARV